MRSRSACQLNASNLQTLDLVVQIFRANGFRRVAVHTRRKAVLAIAHHGMGRQRDDRDVKTSRFFFCRMAAVASYPSISGI